MDRSRHSSPSPDSAPPRPAVSYVRVSSDEQEREGFSLPAQRTLIRHYADQHHLTLLEEYEDVETAKQTGRRAFGAMVAFLKRQRGCRTVLVEKLDRLTRNFRDLGTLEELGVEIHFIKENQVYSQASRSTDKLMVGFRTLIAKNFIDNLSEETRKGQRQKAAQGLWPSCAPLGYLNVVRDGGRVIAPDPVRAPLVTTLFDTYATGRVSLKDLRRLGAELGLRSRNGHPLARGTLHHLLRSRIYTGDFDWDGTTYPGTHPPLVSQDIWALVQDHLTGRGVRRRRRATHDFAFSRLITCGHCGCALVGERKKQRYTYYHCTGYRGKCPEPYTREEVLEAEFTSLLRTLSVDAALADWMGETLRSVTAKDRDDHRQAVRRLEQEGARLEHRLEQMYVDKLDGRVTEAFFDRQSEGWRREQDQILATIAQHRDGAQTDRYLEDGVQLLALAQRAAGLFERQPPAEKRRLLNFLLSNCSWKEGTLHAEFRQPFDMLSITAIPPSGSAGDGDAGTADSEKWLLR
jgi:DNA invertase Pin-like site-specific DNA recombinase